MTDFDLHGPWTGAALRSPLPAVSRLTRAWLYLAGVFVAVGAGAAFLLVRG